MQSGGDREGATRRRVPGRARPVDDELEAAGSGLRDICLRGCATLLTGGQTHNVRLLGRTLKGRVEDRLNVGMS